MMPLIYITRKFIPNNENPMEAESSKCILNSRNGEKKFLQAPTCSQGWPFLSRLSQVNKVCIFNIPDLGQEFIIVKHSICI